MNNPNRRQLLRGLARGLGSLVIVANTATIAACAAPTPRPFIAGNAVSAPLGCTELLARDPRGDC